MTTPASRAEIKRYRQFLQDEVDGIFIYRSLAELESDQSLSDVYAQMAEFEGRHLELPYPFPC